MKIRIHQKILTIHIFLIPLFFVWHVFNEYFGLIPISNGARFLLYYFGLSIVLFLIGRLLLKNNLKAGCWASLLLIIFFFWGAFHDLLRSLSLPAFFSSYKFLLPVVFVFIIFLAILLKKKKSPVRLNRFLLMLFSILLLFESIVSVYKSITSPLHKYDFSNEVSLNSATVDFKNRPDIFFIVFDEYASSAALKKYQRYDNSDLDSFLLNKGFYIVTDSKSNYNSTPHSIASTLDLSYLPLSLEGEKTDPKELLKAKYSVKKSLLPQFLKKKGYEIKNLGLMSLESAPAGNGNFFSDQMTEPLYLETLWGRIEKEIWWNVGIRLPVSWAKSSMKAEQEKVVNTNINNLQNIFTELKGQGNTPKFVFGHVMMPHAPYFLNKRGEKRDASYLDYGSSKDSLYTDQLIYSNTWIDSLAKAAIKPFSRPRVIIIEGDHGNRNIYTSGGSYIRDKQFMNLNCWYFSDKNYSTLYDSISPVNTFRVILNKYFDANLPLLKDSTVFLY